MASKRKQVPLYQQGLISKDNEQRRKLKKDVIIALHSIYNFIERWYSIPFTDIFINTKRINS